MIWPHPKSVPAASGLGCLDPRRDWLEKPGQALRCQRVTDHHGRGTGTLLQHRDGVRELIRVDLIQSQIAPRKRRVTTLHVAQFEPLCSDDARNLQHIPKMDVGIPLVIGILLALYWVGQDDKHVLGHDTASLLFLPVSTLPSPL